MSFRIAARYSRPNDVLKTVAAFIFLTLYAGGNTGFGLLHQILHTQEDSVTHSAEQEKDPCHRSIYHFEKESVCAHGSHLTKPDNCDQCQMLCSVDQIIVGDPRAGYFAPYPVDDISPIPGQSQGIASHLPSRAPPII